ncbi:hypothetical protein [Cereibacter sphaeroides]|nr:hypothetical protein [Cereibacter sphaeroides]
MADAFVEDLMSLSDEEILAEAREDGRDPEAFASRMRARFEQVRIASRKTRMAAAKAGVSAARRQETPHPPAVIDMASARARLRQAIDRNPAGLTMAARNESELSDADVLSQLQDLMELGVIDPQDGLS